MVKKKTDINELLFREKFDEHKEIRLYRREKQFVLERIHNKTSMSRDVYDDPEIAYFYYNYLLESKTTHFPYNLYSTFI